MMQSVRQSKKFLAFLGCCAATVLIAVPLRFSGSFLPGIYRLFLSPTEQAAQAKGEYENLLGEIRRMQAGFAGRYAKAISQDARHRVVDEAREAVRDVLVSKVFPLWRGTRTAYNGVTQVPRNGEIACGFFVSTILDHLGFEVERVALARSPALTIIQALSSPQGRSTVPASQPVDRLAEALEKAGQGVYLIGLDHHVGFVVYDQDGMEIHHAGAFRVVGEDIHRSHAVLYESEKGKFLGRLFEDHMMEAWLTGRSLSCPECQKWLGRAVKGEASPGA